MVWRQILLFISLYHNISRGSFYSCWNLADGECSFGDEGCWFQHVNKPNENDSESGYKSIKCKICWKLLKNKNDFMRHRKQEHEENLQMCNLFKK